MREGRSILGVIPARGGSKGIPRKNIKPICQKPLIAWTIEAAKAATLLDRFVVSTEDDEIAAVARHWGADVLKRPEELASDDAPQLSVLQHAIACIPADVVVLMQPTSPIRSSGLVDRCICRFLDAEADSLATGLMCRYIEYGKDVEHFGKELTRQEAPGFFYDDGNVYVIRAKLIEKGDRYGRRIERMLLSREENTEIDDEFDFWLAEQILKLRQR
jgi:N-acylneuraminate cytidylyltransferase